MVLPNIIFHHLGGMALRKTNVKGRRVRDSDHRNHSHLRQAQQSRPREDCYFTCRSHTGGVRLVFCINGLVHILQLYGLHSGVAKYGLTSYDRSRPGRCNQDAKGSGRTCSWRSAKACPALLQNLASHTNKSPVNLGTGRHSKHKSEHT